LVWWRMDGEIRTHSSATVRWTVASTSANTGRYNYFLSPMRKKMQIESTIPHQKSSFARTGIFTFSLLPLHSSLYSYLLGFLESKK